ncbi:MAG: tRNA (N6-threonylcarbamoyladenosine(37)-N6)-methyltransferase TrmO [Clostridia bacterium]|nr:tRNA (N6-threonylcarbamoyladenosine(37)-N6)-methyltransferase TrmO [Clostridia bacterium]
MHIQPIAHMESDFPTKFGIPRQSGITSDLLSRIVFEKEYRQPEAFRGIEAFTHLWIIWGFSEAKRDGWSATVRPPRLGGNVRMGVFATRSPFRPNPLGLSSVQLVKVEEDDKNGLSLVVAGADLMDGTPIYDIKPYIPYTDSHPEASGGFSDDVRADRLEVSFPEELLQKVPAEKQDALQSILRHDPRPHYHSDPDRQYGFFFAGLEIKFRVEDTLLTVTSVEKMA